MPQPSINLSSEHYPFLWVVLAVLLLLPACQPEPDVLKLAYAGSPDTWPPAVLGPGVDPSAELEPLVRDSGKVAKNRAELGKKLFFDPRLSASNQISCASCHDPDLAWGDGRRQSFGHNRQRGQRNAPSLLNVALWDHFFWDGRAASLEEQVLGPLQDQNEMNENLSGLEVELNAIPEYQQAFQEAYGVSKISQEDITVALADFERGIYSRKSRVDRFIEGDKQALEIAEIRGLHLFRTKARCLNCHHGPLLSDQLFHNNGQHLIGRPMQDLGRFEVTGDSSDIGLVRTPMLRDIVYTEPYLHHGNIRELREVLTMYNSGMPQVIPKRIRKSLNTVPKHDPLLRPLGLNSQEIDDLMAFLKALSVRPHSVNVPDLPEVMD